MLPKSKLPHARIKAIIHIIRNRIIPLAVRATVLPHRASERRHALNRRVKDIIPLSLAALVLENVEDAEPVPHLVDGSQAEVVVDGVAARQGAREVDAAVALDDCLVQCLLREVAVAQQAAAEVGEEVQVQRVVAALAQGGLHLGLGDGPLEAAGRPRVVDGEGGAEVLERDARGPVGVVHHVDLPVHLRLRVRAGRGVGRHYVHVGLDADGGAPACVRCGLFGGFFEELGAGLWGAAPGGDLAGAEGVSEGGGGEAEKGGGDLHCGGGGGERVGDERREGCKVGESACYIALTCPQTRRYQL